MIVNRHVDDFFDVLDMLSRYPGYKRFAFTPNDLFDFLEEVMVSHCIVADEDVVQIALVRWNRRPIILYLDKIPRVFNGKAVFWGSSTESVNNFILRRYGRCRG